MLNNKIIYLCKLKHVIMDTYKYNYMSINYGDIMKKILINKNLFIDRTDESEQLANGLKNGSDFVLIAPRRFGKTTLVDHVFKQINKDTDYLILKIDIMKYSGSIRNLAINITDRALSLLDLSGKLFSMLNKVELSLKLKVTWGEVELEPILSILQNKTDETGDLKLLDHSLELLEKIAVKKNKPLIVFLDEFGELHHLGDGVIKLFRSVLQTHKNVSYVFAGSQESLMNKIFVDNNSPFYKFGKLIHLDVLDENEVINYFSIAGFTIEVSQKILKAFECHPYYTSRAIIDLYNNPQYAKDENSFNMYIEQLIKDERAYLDMLIQKLSSRLYTLDIVINIARGLANNFGIEDKSRQYLNNIISGLNKDGYIKNIHRGVYKLRDPLFRIYLLS